MAAGGRRPIVVANWKMHKTIAEARDYLRRFKALLGAEAGARAKAKAKVEVEVGIAPAFTALAAVAEGLQGTEIRLVAQDMWPEPEGAYTGEVSPLMLKELGCHYVIVGHSERRNYFHEDDGLINLKLRAAFRYGLWPILCVGERLEERRSGATEAVLREQVTAALAGLPAEEVAQMVIAYEPVWAIGTGETASPEDADAGAGFIRGLIAQLYDRPTAEAVRVQYGGSVTPENIAELMHGENVDGVLVGGASLDPEKFAAIVEGAADAKDQG